MKNILKDIHFQVPINLFEDFYRIFPETGERKIFLTQCIKEAVKQKKIKNFFAEKIAKEAIETEDL